MNPDFLHDDELTEADLKFLEQWEDLGKDSTTDALYNPNADEIGEPNKGGTDDTPKDGDGVPGGETEGDDDSDGDDFDPDAEGDEPGGEGDEVDDSEMDLSDVESEDEQPREAPKGPSDSDSDDGQTEQETEGDHTGDHDEFDDDDDDYDEDFEPEVDENADTDEKIEEDDGKGERGNSDDQRESDEPLKGEQDDPEDAGELEAEAEQEEIDQEIKNQKDDKEKLPEQNSGKFEGLPDRKPKCDNHCEDNPQDKDGEPCECCQERIKRERELWGVIATDMEGKDIWPGDKLRVVVPISFMRQGAVLTANVPNLEIDPTRVAESTGGDEDDTICWLSGFTISQFTGWHMKGDGPIWTFSKGKKINFVEKIGEPDMKGKQHGDNLEEGDQMDVEDMLEELKNDLNEFGGEEDQDEEKPEIEDDEIDQDEGESDEEKQERHRREGMTGTQHARFDNITERIIKKIGETFGNTVEEVTIGEAEHGEAAYRDVTIKSRGVRYTIRFEAIRDTE